MTNSQCDLEPKNGSKDEGDKNEVSLMGLPPDFPEEGKEKEKAKEPFQANAAAPPDPILILQDMLQQLMMVQKDLQKEMSSITAPVAKESKRMEAALLSNMVDALWAHTLAENAKSEKVKPDCLQNLTNLITNSFSKELDVILERRLEEEIMALGPLVARALTPVVQKKISSRVAERVQRAADNMSYLQLDKCTRRHLQFQFQSSGNKALQEAVQASVDTSIIPAFERSCKVMFEQVGNKLHKGLAEHTSTIQKQIEAAHTPLALTLRSLMFDLLDGQRKLLSMVAAGNPKVFNPVAMKATNGLMPGLPNVVTLSGPLN